MQAEDAILRGSPQELSTSDTHGDGAFSVIEEFNHWRMKPELAEAVAAIKALTAVIRRSEASTMMGLEIELKNASDALKVRVCSICVTFSASCIHLNYIHVVVIRVLRSQSCAGLL